MPADYHKKPLLQVEGLKQYFPVSRTYTVKAVDDVSFQIYPGETYGLVGESGSGKSTIGRSVIRLYDPTAGSILFDGMNISGKLDKAAEEKLRVEMQMIFQDPMASLNPRKKIADIIGEGLDIHQRQRERTAEGRTCRGARGPLPASVFRRAAPARGNSPGPYYEPEAGYRR